MQKSLACTIFLIFTLSLSGQLRPPQRDWFFYDLAHTRYSRGPAGIEQAWFSNSHQFSFMGEWMFGRWWGLGFGLGIGDDNYHHNMRIQTSPIDGQEYYSLMNDTAFTSNKQRITYLFLPLELRIRSKANQRGQYLRVYLGARGGVRINSFAHYETDKLQQRFLNLGDLQRLKAEVYARLGFGAFSLYGAYDLTPVFRERMRFIADEQGGQVFDLSQMRGLRLGLSLAI